MYMILTVIIIFINQWFYLSYYSIAYELIKRSLTNVELDKFYVTQLYEYEPILQVQRTQSCGHSCSGEIRRASLKRKKTFEDLKPFVDYNITASITYSPVYSTVSKNSVTTIETHTSFDVMEQ